MKYSNLFIYIIAGIAALCILYGFLVEPRRLKLTRCELRLPGLPEKWQGRKIAFFSDIHAGTFYTPSLFAKAVTAVQEQKPDLILIGGDFVEERTNFKKESFRSHYAAELSRLSAPLGKFGIFGNHDTETSENKIYVHDLLKDAGVTLLANDAVNIDDMILIGLEESFHQKPDLQAAMQRINDGDNHVRDSKERDAVQVSGHCCTLSEHDMPNKHPHKTIPDSKKNLNRIIMIHQPDDLPTPEATSERDLILSGHSHKGQITLFGQPLYTVEGGKERIYGYFRLHSGAQQITTAGLGMVHIYARFFAPPEIVIIELNS